MGSLQQSHGNFTGRYELGVAEKYLDHVTDFGEAMKKLSEILEQGGDSGVARIAGLQLRNHLTPNGPSLRRQYQQRWLALPEDIRLCIKKNILTTLGTENSRPSSAAQCVAYVAAVELADGQWNYLIPTLVKNVRNAQSTELKQEATLYAIGYICQEVDAEVLMKHSKVILNAIMHGMRSKGPSNHVRLAATTALEALLKYPKITKAIFGKDEDRKRIMWKVNNATQSSDPKIRVAALRCLVQILSLCYKYMDMGRTFDIIFEAMKSDEDEQFLQAIEFWCTVCDKKIDLDIKEAKAAEGRPPVSTSKNRAKTALQYIAPLLTQKLIKKDDSDNEFEWNPSNAASLCLTLLSKYRQDEIVPHVLTFFKSKIKHEHWQFRVAALTAFGSILGSVEENTLIPEVDRVMPSLIEAMKDSSVAVRATAAKIIGRIFELIPEPAINETYLQPLLESLVNGLKDDPRVAAHVCLVFTRLAQAAFKVADCDDSNQPITYCMSNYFDLNIKSLFETAVRQVDARHNLRSAAYEALVEMVKNSPIDCYVTVQKTLKKVLKRIRDELLIVNHTLSQIDRSQSNELQILLCAVLQFILRKVTSEDANEISEDLMKVLLTMLADKAGGVQEEARITILTLVEVLGDDFLKHMNTFMSNLREGLKNHEDYSVCMAAVGLFGDICNALGSKVLPYYWDEIIVLLLEDLSEPSLHHSLKPKFFFALGDIALSIFPHFAKYFDVVIQHLLQASNAQVDCEDDEMIGYLAELRESVLHAYTGIVLGLLGAGAGAGSEMEAKVEPHLEAIVSFMVVLASASDRTDKHAAAIAALMGDLCKGFGHRVLPLLEARPLQVLLDDVLNSLTHHNVASRAIEEMRHLKPMDKTKKSSYYKANSGPDGWTLLENKVNASTRKKKQISRIEDLQNRAANIKEQLSRCRKRAEESKHILASLAVQVPNNTVISNFEVDIRKLSKNEDIGVSIEGNKRQDSLIPKFCENESVGAPAEGALIEDNDIQDSEIPKLSENESFAAPLAPIKKTQTSENDSARTPMVGAKIEKNKRKDVNLTKNSENISVGVPAEGPVINKKDVQVQTLSEEEYARMLVDAASIKKTKRKDSQNSKYTENVSVKAPLEGATYEEINGQDTQEHKFSENENVRPSTKGAKLKKNLREQKQKPKYSEDKSASELVETIEESKIQNNEFKSKRSKDENDRIPIEGPTVEENKSQGSQPKLYKNKSVEPPLKLARVKEKKSQNSLIPEHAEKEFVKVPAERTVIEENNKQGRIQNLSENISVGTPAEGAPIEENNIQDSVIPIVEAPIEENKRQNGNSPKLSENKDTREPLETAPIKDNMEEDSQIPKRIEDESVKAPLESAPIEENEIQDKRISQTSKNDSVRILVVEVPIEENKRRDSNFPKLSEYKDNRAPLERAPIENNMEEGSQIPKFIEAESVRAPLERAPIEENKRHDIYISQTSENDCVRTLVVEVPIEENKRRDGNLPKFSDYKKTRAPLETAPIKDYMGEDSQISKFNEKESVRAPLERAPIEENKRLDKHISLTSEIGSIRTPVVEVPIEENMKRDGYLTNLSENKDTTAPLETAPIMDNMGEDTHIPKFIGDEIVRAPLERAPTEENKRQDEHIISQTSEYDRIRTPVVELPIEEIKRQDYNLPKLSEYKDTRAPLEAAPIKDNMEEGSQIPKLIEEESVRAPLERASIDENKRRDKYISRTSESDSVRTPAVGIPIEEIKRQDVNLLETSENVGVHAEGSVIEENNRKDVQVQKHIEGEHTGKFVEGAPPKIMKRQDSQNSKCTKNLSAIMPLEEATNEENKGKETQKPKCSENARATEGGIFRKNSRKQKPKLIYKYHVL